MNNYNEFSKDMQRLIDRTIMGSIDFCMDMMQDSEEDEVTNLKQFREMVYSQAIYFMQNELDPEYADIVIPARLLEAINERTINAVQISFSFKGA